MNSLLIIYIFYSIHRRHNPCICIGLSDLRKKQIVIDHVSDWNAPWNVESTKNIIIIHMYCEWKHCHRECGSVIIRDGGFRGTHKRDAENLRWPNPVGTHIKHTMVVVCSFLDMNIKVSIYMWACKLAFKQNYIMWAEF